MTMAPVKKTLREVNQLLLYTEARRIVRFINEHPFNLYHEYRNETFLGGRADKWPGIPIIDLFLELYSQKRGLFSQQEFIDFCLSRLEETPFEKELRDPVFKTAFAARLGRNFYVAFMKQLHVSSFCIELGWFHQCWWDATTDSSSKHDLIAVRDEKPPIAIDMIVDTQRAVEAYNYKKKYRSASGSDVSKEYLVKLPLRRHSPGGNAIWYCPKDFEQIILEYCHDYSLWEAPAIPCYWGCHR